MKRGTQKPLTLAGTPPGVLPHQAQKRITGNKGATNPTYQKPTVPNVCR